MIQSFLDKMEIPEACRVDRTVFKKLFLENADLAAADKKALKEDIDKIKILYSFTKENLHIQPFSDEVIDYQEVAILTISLLSQRRLARIAKFVQKAIPYPLILVFTYQDSFLMELADKRIHQVDKEKSVIMGSWQTDWINLENPSICQSDFMADCLLNTMSFHNFLAFYASWRDRVTALNVGQRTGYYRRVTGKETASCLVMLEDIEKREQALTPLRASLKKESQMGAKIELNTKIRQHKQAIEQLIENLKQVCDIKNGGNHDRDEKRAG